MAKRAWPGEDPLGKRVACCEPGPDGGPNWKTIVGVVADIHARGLGRDAPAEFYLPMAQAPKAAWRWIDRTMTLAARTSGEPIALAPAMRDAVWSVDRSLPVYDISTMDDRRTASLAASRFSTTLLGVFGGIALLLAAIGVYGVISYGVTQRAQEIGIRVALGAGRGRVLRLVVGHAAALTGVGLALGLVGAVTLARLMGGLLFQREPDRSADARRGRSGALGRRARRGPAAGASRGPAGSGRRAPGGVTMSLAIDPLIRLQGVSRIFHADEVETHALSRIDLEIRAGEYLAVCGPSGCGKTTLLSMLGLLDTPSEGSYVLAGEPVSTLSVAQRARVRARAIGFIFQAFNLIGDLTVYDNVELPLRYRGMPAEERRTAALAALDRVGLLHRLSITPRSCRAASSSASRWRARSRGTRWCSWPMSRPATSIPPTAPKSPRCCAS